MTNKKLIVPMAAILLTTGTLFVTPQAHAQTNGTNGGGNFFGGLIQFIEQKFGLNHAQVQSAVNEYRQNHPASLTPRPSRSPQLMQDMEKVRLDRLVKKGKLTTDQENAIITEVQTLRSKYGLDSMSNLNPQDRRSKMQQMESDLKTWAQTHNIDPKLLGPGGRRHW
jgi:polyhydroxyalkanoate synthesis regulator phasin